MQTTLLGLAIALILALLAAIVGPYFVDWNQFRPQFEAEASRVVGLPVRVKGALDARLLPTPSLTLHGVSLQLPNQPNAVSADKLDVTFTLGSLMRGEWRADEMAISGLALNLGLDDRGRFDWPASSAFNPASLTIDRLSVTGKVVFSDRSSGKTIHFDDLVFSGEVNGASSAIRGEGQFGFGDGRFPFRLSSSRAADGSGQRLHLGLDLAARTTAELDGTLTAERAVPLFNGTMAFGRALALRNAANADGGLVKPWQVTGKLTADPSKARLDQIEASYGGSTDAAIKLTGAADVTLGASPSIAVALSARQIDADRLLTQNDVDAAPAQLLSVLRQLLLSTPIPPLPVRLDVGLDTVMLGVRPVQGVVLAMRSDNKGWTLDNLAFSPPGATHMAIHGQISNQGAAEEFAGGFDLDANDPELLFAWIQGRSVTGVRSTKRLRASGQMVVGSDRFSVGALAGDLDGAQFKGDFSLATGSSQRLTANVTADRLDLDAASAFVRNFTQTDGDWPRDAKIDLDLGQATVLGQDAHELKARLISDPSQFKVETLSVGDVNGFTINGSAVFDRARSTGHLALTTATRSFQRLADLAQPFSLPVAARLRSIADDNPARMQWAIDLGADNSSKRSLHGAVDVDAQPIKGKVSIDGVADLTNGIGFDTLSKTTVKIGSSWSSPDAKNLLALFGLDHVLASTGAAQLEASATGRWQDSIQLQAKLTGQDLDADLKGTLAKSGEQPKGSFAVAIHRANAAPLIGATSSRIPLAMSTSLDVADGRLTMNNLTGTWAGSQFRGKLVVQPADMLDINGDVGVDQLNLPAALAIAFGSEGPGSDKPLAPALIGGWRGRVAFQSLSASLPDGVTMRPIGGVVTSDGTSLAINDLSGSIGGGQAKGNFSLKRTNDGVALDARLQFADVDGAALHDRALVMPAAKISGQVSFAGNGRSTAGLIGSLSGNGALKIAGMKIPGLDPGAFDAVVRATDQGLAIDVERISPVVEKALAAGSLNIASADLPFTISNGRLRIDSSVLDAGGAQLTLTGGYDIPATQLDLSASLMSTTVSSAQSAGRPAIQVTLRGSPDGTSRTMDVTALSSWLALRAIDRETKRLETLERAPQQASQPPTPQTTPPVKPQRSPQVIPQVPPSSDIEVLKKQSDDNVSSTPEISKDVPPLPPAIMVRPAPGQPRSQTPTQARPKTLPPPLVLVPNIPR